MQIKSCLLSIEKNSVRSNVFTQQVALITAAIKYGSGSMLTRNTSDKDYISELRGFVMRGFGGTLRRRYYRLCESELIKGVYEVD